MEKLKILIPTDFTIEAEHAYNMVKNMQKYLSIQIHFLHVLMVPDTVSINLQGEIETCGEIDRKYVEQQRDIALEKLDNLRRVHGVDIQTHLLLGKVTNSILEFSTKEQIDLIVMGTKGSWGFQEKISGSATQVIARKSKVPVLSLMCDRSDLLIQHVLLVHDFRSRAILEFTLLNKLIQAFKATIHFLQIIKGNDHTVQEEIKTQMREFAQINRIDKFECHILRDVDVENGVIHFNQMSNMDIICIGTHGKGGLLHTSATEKLINHLYKPIISFHLNN